jgi:hypothetical protein
MGLISRANIVCETFRTDVTNVRSTMSQQKNRPTNFIGDAAPDTFQQTPFSSFGNESKDKRTNVFDLPSHAFTSIKGWIIMRDESGGTCTKLAEKQEILDKFHRNSSWKRQQDKASWVAKTIAQFIKHENEKYTTSFMACPRHQLISEWLTEGSSDGPHTQHAWSNKKTMSTFWYKNFTERGMV